LSFHLNLIAEYKTVFPDLQDDLENLAGGIPKKLIIQAATTFLGMNPFNPETADWQMAVKNWFRHANKDFADDVFRRFYSAYGSKGLTPSIYSPISNLKLLQLGLEKTDQDDIPEKSEEQIEIDLFKIYLLLNGFLAERYLPSREFIKEKYPDHPAPFLLLYMGFAVSDLVNYIQKREMYCQSVKALFLFRFLADNQKIKFLADRFCKYYEIKDPKEYFGMLLPLLRDISAKKQEGFFEFNLTKDEQYEKSLSFIDKLAIQKYNAADDLDYKSIRSQPFVQLEENKYRITHPLFFTDKIFKGVFFDLSRLNNEAPANERIKEFRSFYGTEFSERFVFYEIMKYSFKKRYIQFTGKDFEEMKLDGRSDYYIRNSNSIFLFECKEVLINASIKENGISKDLEAEFQKKFIADGKNPKAIRQLVNNITFIINEKNDFDRNYKVKNIKIYPILILHDVMFESAGFNYLLNFWFTQEIESLRQLNKEMPTIKPLIVLGIDTLILISDLLRDNKITLKEVLEEYYKSTKFNPKRVFRDEEDFKNKLTDTYLPSSISIDNWLKKAFPKTYPNSVLLKALLAQTDQEKRKL
jgi:hypothetical protein